MKNNNADISVSRATLTHELPCIADDGEFICWRWFRHHHCCCCSLATGGVELINAMMMVITTIATTEVHRARMDTQTSLMIQTLTTEKIIIINKAMIRYAINKTETYSMHEPNSTDSSYTTATKKRRFMIRVNAMMMRDAGTLQPITIVIG